MYMMIVPRKNFDLFDEFFDDPFFHKEDKHPHPMAMMKTDVRENDNSYIIDVDLPGFQKDNIKVDVEDGYLNISASMDNTEEEKDKGKFIRRERFVGECSRSFYVGEQVQSEDIKASFKNGILTLEIPKVEEEEKLPEKKYVQIGE